MNESEDVHNQDALTTAGVPEDDTEKDKGADEVEGIEPEEEPMGVPFGMFGITLLQNILQYTVFLGLTMVVLIILQMFAPAEMIP